MVQVMDEIDQSIAENSKRRKVLKVLAGASDEKGYIKGIDSNSIAAQLNLSVGEVNKALWQLQKEEMVGFTENKKEHYLTRFRLRQKALETMWTGGGVAKEVADAIQQRQEAQLIDLGVTMPTERAYPNLKELLLRKTKLTQAAKLLEEAGADDTALRVMDDLDHMTPLEKEVIDYFEQHIDLKLKIVHDS